MTVTLVNALEEAVRRDGRTGFGAPLPVADGQELDFEGERCNRNEKTPPCSSRYFCMWLSPSRLCAMSIIQKISFLIVPNLHANCPYPEKGRGRLGEYRVMSEITKVQTRRVFVLSTEG